MNSRPWLRILKSGPFLLLAGLAVTLFILTFGYWYLRAQRQEVEHLARENLSAVLEGKIATITGWVRERTSDGHQVTEQPRLQRFLRDVENTPLAAEIERWMASMREDYGYAALVLLDQTGHPLLESPTGAGERFARHLPHVATTLRERNLGITEIHRSPVDGTIHFAVTAPISVTEEGAAPLTGLVLMVIDAEDYLFPLVQAWPYKSDTSEALLVRREGDEVLFLHDLRHRPGAALSLRLPLDDPDLPAAVSLRGAYTSVREGDDYRGVPVLAATAPVPGTPWHMVVKTDKTEVYAGFNRNSRNWAIQMGLLVGLLWLGGFMFWRRNRIEHLQEELERKAAATSAAQDTAIRMKLATTSTGLGVWEWRVSEGRMLWDEQMFRIYGWEVTADHFVTYADWRAAVLPEDWEKRETPLQTTNDGQPSQPVEFRIRRADTGEIRHLVSIHTSRTDETGATPLIVGTSLDITERKQAEESLRRNAQLLEASQAIAKVGGWELDVVTKELFWTDETYRLHDSTPEEFNPTVDAALEFYLPESRRQISAALDAAMTTGEGYDLELETLTTKGRLIHVRTTCEVACWEGQPIKLMGTFQDITERKAAETELRLNAQLLEASQAIAKVGGWELDVATHEVFWTRETYRLHDTTPEEFNPTVDAGLECYLPESRRRLSAALEVAMSTGEGYDLELELRTTKGRLIHVRTNCEVTCREGQPVKLTGAFQDITERKQAEERLFEQITRVQLATEVAGVGIWQWNVRTNELKWDDQIATIYGFTTRSGTIEDWSSAVLPEELAEQQRLVAHTIETKGTSRREFRIKRASDGAVRILQAAESVRLDEAGEVEWLIGSNVDITDRRNAEDEIRQLSTVVEQSPVSIVITDLGGNIQYTNPYFSELTGYTADEVRGKNPRILKSGETTPHDYADLWRKISAGRAWHGLFHNRRKDGSLFWEDAVISPLTNQRDKVTGYLAIKTDVTQRIRAEKEIRELNRSLEERVRRRTQELETANQELESFSYSVSHDLRAPLRAIDGWAQVLLDDFGAVLQGEGENALNRLRAATQRMGALIDDLLRLSRVNRQELERSPVAMRTLVEEVIKELRAGDQDHPATISIGPLADGEGSAVLLRQVWANLIGNALKFTRKEESPEIKVGSRIESSGNLVYFVKDNGAGFDMAYADKLFGAFQRLHSAREFEGSGIGLALSQRIVRRHGGRIWAEGEVGVGAEFCFTLSPVSPDQTLILNPTHADER